MIKEKIKKISVVAVCGLILCPSLVTATSEIEDLKNERTQLDVQIQEQETEIQGINNQLDKVVGEIKALDFQISKSQKELENLNVQIAQLELDIKKNEENLEKARESLEAKQDELNTRIREQYKSGDVIFLEVLMGSSSVKEMLTKLDIVEDVLNQDKELLDFTSKQINYIEETEEKLRNQKEELQIKLDVEKIKKQELEAANNEKIRYMAVLEENRIAAESQYDEFINLTTSLDQKIVQLEEELEAKRKAEEEARKKAEEARRLAAEQRKQSLNASSNNGYSDSEIASARGEGGLIWPVSSSSRISSYYGYRVHPIFNTRKFHAGIDIPAPTGSAISAAESGIVIYSGWQGGYGNVVMISHGDGLVTVYAHNSANLVSVGDYVDAGDTISLCGSTGYSTGPHLHFEVRINGSTADPLSFL